MSLILRRRIIRIPTHLWPVIINCDLHVRVGILPLEECIERRLDLDQKLSRLERGFICRIKSEPDLTAGTERGGDTNHGLCGGQGSCPPPLAHCGLFPYPGSVCTAKRLSAAFQPRRQQKTYGRVCVCPCVFPVTVAIVDGWDCERIYNGRGASWPGG